MFNVVLYIYIYNGTYNLDCFLKITNQKRLLTTWNVIYCANSAFTLLTKEGNWMQLIHHVCETHKEDQGIL